MKCHWCSSDIADGASICPVCKHYQLRRHAWRSYLPYIGGFAAVLALLGTAGTFIAAKAIEGQWFETPTPGLRVLTVDSSKLIVLENTGNQDLFVRMADFRCPALDYQRMVAIDHRLNRGEILPFLCCLDHSCLNHQLRCADEQSAQAEYRSRRDESDVLVACLDEEHPRLTNIRRDFEESPQVFSGIARLYYQALGDDAQHVEIVVCGAIVIQRADVNGAYSPKTWCSEAAPAPPPAEEGFRRRQPTPLGPPDTFIDEPPEAEPTAR